MSETLRDVGAAFLGYVVMFATLFVAFSILWVVLGPQGSFRPESWEVAPAWVVAAVVLGLLAAVVGGWVCAKTGATRRAIHILIGIIVLMAVVSALPDATVVTEARTPDVTMFEAMSRARQPGWLLVVNPLIGILGVALGGRLGGKL